MSTAISEFKKLVAPDVLPCPDPIITREVISVLLEFCKKTNILQRDFELEVDVNDIDPDLQDSIDFDISEFCNGLRPHSILEIKIDGSSKIPQERDIKTTLSHWDTLSNDYIKYYWIVRNNVVRIFDINTSNSVIWMNIALKPLRTSTSVDDFIFEDWSEAIVAGAKWKILKMPGKEWTDEKAAEDYRREYRKYLSQAKVRVLKGGTGVYQETIQWKSFE